MSRPPSRGRRIARLALVVYLIFLAVVLLAPTSDVQSATLARTAAALHSLGVPAPLLITARLEFIANVLLVVPAAVLAAWIWRSVRWTTWTAYAFLGSLTVEGIQALLWTGRSATFSDVVANTLGGLLGAVGCVTVLAVGRAAEAQDPARS